MTHSLFEVAKRCSKITESYLLISSGSAIIQSTQNAIRVTQRCLLEDVFPKWNPLEGAISFSYNGGKDCQALLVIYLACLWEYFMRGVAESQYDAQYQRFWIHRLPAVYIDQAETYGSLENFVEATVERYALALYESPKERKVSMAEAFKDYLELYPKTKAIVIGIRHTDPYAEKLSPVQKTDAGWPEFIRVQPLLHWKLANIWSFLLYSGEEICGLYQVGFTSIGGINSTTRNPYLLATKAATEEGTVSNEERINNHFTWEISNAYGLEQADDKPHCSALTDDDLRLIASHSQQDYLPGWFLINDRWERAGRDSRA
ncbi:AER198Wp [Eremothecium gossypii ATCC 10895]|uniref:FAD synthase n=1 Tax=Eremothecium gossypii (strain ATCC 10895 / CBS 109.51 / FGSC 9923 / NRRL Y-1056) TaxID=284811 RepID=Q756Q6_EREGS|nr:AER198Wp [Eremothecium gossypii ATCC 10895]AAS52879.1 AER198Wp [Eremothecium gossypii ATCC 10895]AEY97186.1 FAER198Wp [Eremothecium gossypii FDAG1]